MTKKISFSTAPLRSSRGRTPRGIKSNSSGAVSGAQRSSRGRKIYNCPKGTPFFPVAINCKYLITVNI